MLLVAGDPTAIEDEGEAAIVGAGHRSCLIVGLGGPRGLVQVSSDLTEGLRRYIWSRCWKVKRLSRFIAEAATLLYCDGHKLRDHVTAQTQSP